VPGTGGDTQQQDFFGHRSIGQKGSMSAQTGRSRRPTGYQAVSYFAVL